VYSRADENDGLIIPKSLQFGITKCKPLVSLDGLKPIFTLMRGYDNQINNPPLNRLTKLMKPKENIRIILILRFKLLTISSALLMRIWVSKCKLYTLYVVCKEKIEF